MSGPPPVDEVLALERASALRATSKWVGLLLLIFLPAWAVVDQMLVPDEAHLFVTVRLAVMVLLVLLWGSLWSPQLSDRGAAVPALLLCLLPQAAVAWMAPRTGDALEVYLLGYTLIIYAVALLIVSGGRFAAVVLAHAVLAMAVSFALQRSLVDGREFVVLALYLVTAVTLAAAGRGYRMGVERREVEARLALEQEQARTLALVKELDERARQDHLTGLDNRRAWDEALKTAFSTARRAGHDLSVLVVDVDRFKSSTTATATPPAMRS
jgi:hypothetical protein